MRKATIKGQTVIVDTAYCNTMAHSISVTDPQPILGRAVDILQEKQLQFLPVPFLGASQQYTTFTWEYFSTVLFCSCTHRGKRLKCHWFLLGVTHTPPCTVAAFKQGITSEGNGGSRKIVHCDVAPWLGKRALQLVCTM